MSIGGLTMSDKIDYEKAAIYYADKYKKTAAHNRQLIDDIEKADSDYFKMKKNRDEWKDAFYKSVDEFKKLSEICDRLTTAREMLTEEVNDLKDELDNINAEKEELQDDIDYYDNVTQDLRVRNENYLDEIEKLKERIKNLQNVIERLGGENG
jgi:chromosome segregation ATPase